MNVNGHRTRLLCSGVLCGQRLFLKLNKKDHLDEDLFKTLFPRDTHVHV